MTEAEQAKEEPKSFKSKASKCILQLLKSWTLKTKLRQREETNESREIIVMNSEAMVVEPLQQIHGGWFHPQLNTLQGTKDFSWR